MTKLTIAVLPANRTLCGDTNQNLPRTVSLAASDVLLREDFKIYAVIAMRGFESKPPRDCQPSCKRRFASWSFQDFRCKQVLNLLSRIFDGIPFSAFYWIFDCFHYYTAWCCLSEVFAKSFVDIELSLKSSLRLTVVNITLFHINEDLNFYRHHRHRTLSEVVDVFIGSSHYSILTQIA